MSDGGTGGSDGIGGLILLGAVVLVGAALFGGGGKKKEVEVLIEENPPEVEPPEQSVQCCVCGTSTDLRKCTYCDNFVCRQHDSPCLCGCMAGCPSHRWGGGYCQSCE